MSKRIREEEVIKNLEKAEYLNTEVDWNGEEVFIVGYTLKKGKYPCMICQKPNDFAKGNDKTFTQSRSVTEHFLNLINVKF